MLERNLFVIKERVKVLSSVQGYDILDAETGAPIGFAEETISTLIQCLRWVMSKALLPTRIEVREKPDDSLVFTMRRGWYIFKSRVEVHDPDGNLIGYFKSKVLTISGGFHVYDKNDTHFAEVKGKWVGFNYRFLSPDHAVEMGKVTKKLGAVGILKEMFTSADTFAVEVNPELANEPLAKILILAATLAIDMIYKSESSNSGASFLGE